MLISRDHTRYLFTLDKPPELQASHFVNTATMRFLRSLLPFILLSCAGLGQAASSWGFEEGVVSVNVKGGAGVKEKYELSLHGVLQGFKLTLRPGFPSVLLFRKP